MQQESGVELGASIPVQVPYFMAELIEEITIQSRKSKFIDQASVYRPDSLFQTIER